MNDWTDWEIVRHQVAISGRALDDRDQPVAGAQVTISTMPKALRQKIDDAARGAGVDEREDQTLTNAEGLYYFLDLPGGRYTLKGLDRQSGARGEKTVSVTWSRDGTVKRARADLKLLKA
jgi:hypothetical protein